MLLLTPPRAASGALAEHRGDRLGFSRVTGAGCEAVCVEMAHVRRRGLRVMQCRVHRVGQRCR